ncbi:hypothetical protein GCM10007385_39550 [Tateyamaria omphalii]|uniref:hypothetical protein n=1 Tax=Tateyamaria omphalii TaxID=299262 RepID=UPI0016734EF9|nr:hypothetical protein GCM10007385_39550 [Tateyamaria omphalii]
MALMHSHVIDQLERLKNPDRKMSFLHGTRSKRETVCVEDFDKLAKECPNFTFYSAVPDAMPEHGWKGAPASSTVSCMTNTV